MQKKRFDFLCPACKSAKYSYLGPYIAQTELFKDREIAKCLQCQLVSMHPCLIEGVSANYYEKQYWTDELLKRRLPSLQAQAHSRCVFMRSAVSNNGYLRVLDVGAGIGYMNWGVRAVWPDAKVEYTAIEVNPAAVKYLHSDQGVDHCVKDLAEVRGVFDVIVLSHILEHITEPVNFLSKIASLLNQSGGCLFVEVPNLDFKFKKRNEPHVLFYSPETLANVLNIQDFQVIKIATCGEPIWKKRADGGMDAPRLLLTLRSILYKLTVRSNSKFSIYGGHRQWIRAICRFNKTGCL